MWSIFIIWMMQLLGPSPAEVDVVHEKAYEKPPIEIGYFRSPVNHNIKLSGTFGELRPNHFHTGIDIKTSAGVEGDPVYAVADGWVARIGIGPRGYGNALYIAHPNGYSSVYAHLQKLEPTLTDYILKEQHKQRRFDVQLYPDSGALIVKKGEIIGRIGNSGSSMGAHLHFEIRETESETPVNPFLFGSFKVTDNIPPTISYVRIYDLDDDFNEFNAQNVLAAIKNKLYTPRTSDTIRTKSSKIGMGINTRDIMEGSWNKNGIYEIKMFVDDTLHYHLRMDSVTFFKTRMINAHIDYPEQKLKKNYVHKCFTMPGNSLGIIRHQSKAGVIHLNIATPKKITYEVADFNGNVSKLRHFVVRDAGEPKFTQSYYNYLLPYNQPSIIRQDGIDIHFPSGTFFKNNQFNLVVMEDNSNNIYSKTYKLGNENTPVFDYFDIKITATDIPKSLRSKAFIASCDNNNRIYNWGGKWEDNDLVGSVRDLDSYYITADTIKPSITPIIFSGNMSKSSKIVFKIDDNIRPAGKTPLLSYNAYIDDQWVLMNYDLKTKTITHVFPPNFPKGTHQFKLEVYDMVGNIAVYQSQFNK